MNSTLKTSLVLLMIAVIVSLIISSIYLLSFSTPRPSSISINSIQSRIWVRTDTLALKEEQYRKDMDITQGECACTEGQSDAKRKYTGTPLHSHGERGSLDREEWNKKRTVEQEPIVVCPSLSPLEYVGGGLTVEPKKSIKLAGLSVHESFITYPPDSVDKNDDVSITFTSLKGFGKIFVEVPDLYREYVNVVDNWKQKTELRVRRDYDLFMLMLKHVQYHSTYYDINHRDTVEVQLLNYVIHIHVHIKRKTPPRLYDPGPDNLLSWRITITTATQNQASVKRLINSVRTFYPNLTIVVGDYSSERHMLNLTDVKQYFLPDGYNEFSALSLAVSQVRTKFFLLVKDNYIFTERTKLEHLVDKLENVKERLHVVGGFFENERGEIMDGDEFYKTFRSKSDHINGDCVVLKYGGYRKLDNYTQCTVVDAVQQFFAGKTLPWWGVGFDPTLQPLGLDAVFIEALGTLRIAICTDVTIYNPDLTSEKSLHDKQDDLLTQSSAEALMFKSNLQCFNL
ncbi:beta-1,4 N-acetylgalactosaminyltransferase 2-like [Glandiceps talaboti]